MTPFTYYLMMSDRGSAVYRYDRTDSTWQRLEPVLSRWLAAEPPPNEVLFEMQLAVRP